MNRALRCAKRYSLGAVACAGFALAAGGCFEERTEFKPSAETTPWLVPAKQIELLNSSDARARILAARNLGKMGKGGAEAIPALEKLLEDKDVKVREAAADALEKIRSE